MLAYRSQRFQVGTFNNYVCIGELTKSSVGSRVLSNSKIDYVNINS